MLFRILIFAVLTYIVVKIIQLFSRLIKGDGEKNKFSNPTPTSSKISKDDIIDADFEDISENDKKDNN